VWPEVRTALEDVYTPRHEVLFTGHSLGGALAVLAAARWWETQPQGIDAIHTFGQPRVAQGDFQEAFGANLSLRCHRFVNNKDIVPRVPPGFDHVGQLMWFDRAGDLHPEVGLESSLSAPGVVSTEEWEDIQRRARNSAAGLQGIIPGSDDHPMATYLQLVKLALSHCP
jgi:pimeloyl-ACP methyl ester carboxylesterase